MTHFHGSQTLVETGGPVVFGSDGELALMVDKAPLVAHANTSHSLGKVTVPKFGMLHQDPPAARHIIELRPGQVISVTGNEAPFPVHVHGGETTSEQARLVKLRID